MKKKFNPRDPYIPNTEEEKLIKMSALQVIEFVTKNKEIHPHIRKIVIGYMQWALTEIKMKLKYKTRYYSVSALEMKEKLRHEHVFTRKYVTNLILNNYDAFQKLVPEIVGCTVTKSEALLLNRIDKDVEGWNRYALAGIQVYDRLTGKLLKN
jgi:hypothetical protein